MLSDVRLRDQKSAESTHARTDSALRERLTADTRMRTASPVSKPARSLSRFGGEARAGGRDQLRFGHQFACLYNQDIDFDSLHSVIFLRISVITQMSSFIIKIFLSIFDNKVLVCFTD